MSGLQDKDKKHQMEGVLLLTVLCNIVEGNVLEN